MCSQFDGEHLFDYPKPVALLQHLLELAILAVEQSRLLCGLGTTGVHV